MSEIGGIVFDDQGLVPAVVQDWRDGTVLMVGFMNSEALALTLKTGRVHFWSRSRQTLWQKGETSGNALLLKEAYLDCDQDTLLMKVDPLGPTCHTGERACFFTRLKEDGTPATDRSTGAWGGIFERIEDTILVRRASPQPGSYVSALFEGGPDRMLKKVVEEAGEVVLASKNGARAEIIHEVADLLFHTMVVLGHHGIALQEIYRELSDRVGKPGLRPVSSKRGQGE